VAVRRSPILAQRHDPSTAFSSALSSYCAEAR
jgi:hypothetical protein